MNSIFYIVLYIFIALSTVFTQVFQPQTKEELQTAVDLWGK